MMFVFGSQLASISPLSVKGGAVITTPHAESHQRHVKSAREGRGGGVIITPNDFAARPVTAVPCKSQVE